MVTKAIQSANICGVYTSHVISDIDASYIKGNEYSFKV